MARPEEVRFASKSKAPAAPWQLLSRRFELKRKPAQSFVRTYLDSFDWGIYRKSATLVQESQAGRRRIRLSTPQRQMTARFSRSPRFARDFPKGPLRDFIRSSVGIRVLLPLIRVQGRKERLDLLDGSRQTVVRVRLERRSAVTADGSRSIPLPPCIRVEAIGGSRQPFRRAVDCLNGHNDWERTDRGELTEALEAVGREPLPYSPKFKLTLDPEERADAAMKKVHRFLFGVMRANEEGVISDLDPEFLHDFRVAVRRTRSALTQVKGVFPPTIVTKFRREFAWLGRLTGPTRDLHVYRLKMKAYRSAMPEATAERLASLDSFLRQRQEHAHREMVRSLHSRRFGKLMPAWGTFLERPVPRTPSAARARDPIVRVASERLVVVYRRVLKRGTKIKPHTPAEALHQLRIECKKLRYLLEFFRSLCERKRVVPFIKELRKLQDNLGDFNDLQVQQEALKKWAVEMAEQNAASPALTAMDRLAGHLEQLQALERKRFGKQFADFSVGRNQALFRQLIGGRENLS